MIRRMPVLGRTCLTNRRAGMRRFARPMRRRRSRSPREALYRSRIGRRHPDARGGLARGFSWCAPWSIVWSLTTARSTSTGGPGRPKRLLHKPEAKLRYRRQRSLRFGGWKATVPSTRPSMQRGRNPWSGLCLGSRHSTAKASRCTKGTPATLPAIQPCQDNGIDCGCDPGIGSMNALETTGPRCHHVDQNHVTKTATRSVLPLCVLNNRTVVGGLADPPPIC